MGPLHVVGFPLSASRLMSPHTPSACLHAEKRFVVALKGDMLISVYRLRLKQELGNSVDGQVSEGQRAKSCFRRQHSCSS